MNEKLQEFIASVGILVELWLIIHKSFISNGCDEKTALAHTQAFMKTAIESFGTSGGDDK